MYLPPEEFAQAGIAQVAVHHSHPFAPHGHGGGHIAGDGGFALVFADTGDQENFGAVGSSVIFQIGTDGIDLSDALAEGEAIGDKAPIFVMLTDEDGSLTGEILENPTVAGKVISIADIEEDLVGKPVMVDYYISKVAESVSELQIDAENFAGYFYVEADTLFRRQHDGVDMPAVLTLPNVKIQSNFTFAMASTGDPSTFSFTMDAFPGYTYFNQNKQVLCVIQVVEDSSSAEGYRHSVMHHVKEVTE